MTKKSTSDHYGSVAITLHWLSALIIVAALGSGLRAADVSDLAVKAQLLRVHIVLAVTVLLLTLTRIAWWVFADTKPAAIPMPRWQDRLSRLVHVLFYIVILGMAASGIGMLVLSGAGAVIFGQSTASLPDFWDYLPRVPHGLGARALIGLFLFHAGAALFHHFVQKDGLMRRMWFNGG